MELTTLSTNFIEFKPFFLKKLLNLNLISIASKIRQNNMIKLFSEIICL